MSGAFEPSLFVCTCMFGWVAHRRTRSCIFNQQGDADKASPLKEIAAGLVPGRGFM